MIHLYKDKKSSIITNFRISPRDFIHTSVLLPLETISALNKAANILQEMSHGQYEIALTRGYIKWTPWRRIKEIIGKLIFYVVHWNDKSAAKLLFSSNGHDDGFSVDIRPYDVRLQKALRFLSWKNIMTRRKDAETLLSVNSDLIGMIDASMHAAGFIGHPDPREKLQMHYRLVSTLEAAES